MDEIKRNGEGYYDPTAYEAIKRMEDTDMEEVKAGEVWEAVTGTETGLFIILKNNSRYVTVLYLTESAPSTNSFRVTLDPVMYTDCGRSSYVFPDRLIRHVTTLTENEFKELKNGVAKALEFPQIVQVKTGAIQTTAKEPDPDFMIDLGIEKTEKRVYKSLYENLLREVIGQ